MKEYFKLGLVLLLIVFFSLFTMSLFSQSIMIDNQKRTMVEFSEEEKAIKASSGCILAKKNIEWETTLNTVLIKWKVEYKDTKNYILYRNGIKYYETTTITGIRSKYASDLLGRDIKIQ